MPWSYCHSSRKDAVARSRRADVQQARTIGAFDVVVVMQASVSVKGRARIARDGQSVDPECLAALPNLVDFVALEEALKLRESGKAATVTCVAAGAAADAVLAHGLAMGADRIVRVEAPEGLYVDARVLARSIVGACTGQLVVIAGQSANGEADALPHEIAAALDAACLTNVTVLRVSNGEVEAERWLEKGRREIWGTRLPAVVAVAATANNPRYVTVAALALARRSASLQLVAREVVVPATESDAATALQKLVTPRIRPKRIAGNSSKQSVSERLRVAVSGDSAQMQSGKPVSGPPTHVADAIVAFLDERGLLEERRK